MKLADSWRHYFDSLDSNEEADKHLNILSSATTYKDDTEENDILILHGTGWVTNTPLPKALLTRKGTAYWDIVFELESILDTKLFGLSLGDGVAVLDALIKSHGWGVLGFVVDV